MAPSPSASYLTESLPHLVPPIFEQAQNTTANHRKNIVQLRKIQETCADITEKSPKGIRLIGERAFNAILIDMINRILPIKKGVTVADRVVKFVAGFVTYSTQQDTEMEDDSMSSRFVTKLVKHLLAGMEAKDKNVRFRVTLLTVSLINGLGEIDDDLYVQLRQSLLNRSRDKEAAVRVQAALGIAKLQSGEDEEDLEEGEESLGETLLDLLRYDPDGQVRRAALYNMPRNPETLPMILARTRDIDPILRRTVYHGPLGAAGLPDARILSIAQREDVSKNGLGDRNPSVRKAAAVMLGGWLDQSEGDLLEFLARFDVVSSEVAEDALISIFVTRPEVFDNLEFGDEFWEALTPEKAFLARVFADHCASSKNDGRLEEAMPVVTALAYRIQDEYNKLVTATNNDEDVAQEQAFIVEQLLRAAVTLDYADEIGRRKMFQLSREMISQPNLPEALIPRCVDVLKLISNGDRDLIRLIVDVVTELREGDGDVEASEAPSLSRPPLSPSRPTRDLNDPGAKMRAALIDLRCLLICISLLERVNTPLQENSVFHGLVPDLILPAIRNKEEPALRDQGLVCLGLCCLLDEKMAANSFGLYVHQLTQADDQTKAKVIQVIFDLLTVHNIDTLVSKTFTSDRASDRVVELVRHMLAQNTPEVQAIACEGAAKLMLADMIDSPIILQSLVLLYFSPETADNQPLRQCLTYFLPVYCYSSPRNQRRMLSIFPDTFEMLSALEDEFEDATDILPLSQMGLNMIDWLDPFKAVERQGVTVDHSLHLDLAVELLKSILTEESREIRKTMVGFLSKLNLPENVETEPWKTKAAHQLCLSIKSKRPMGDAVSRNSLTRFEGVLSRKYPELAGYDEDAFRAEGDEVEATRELFGFIDDVEETTGSPDRSRRGSRAPSVARSTASRHSVETDSDTTPVKRNTRPSRPATVLEENESDGAESDDVDAMLDSD